MQKESNETIVLNDEAHARTNTKVSPHTIDLNDITNEAKPSGRSANKEEKRHDLRESLDIQDDELNKGAGDWKSSNTLNTTRQSDEQKLNSASNTQRQQNTDHSAGTNSKLAASNLNNPQESNQKSPRLSKTNLQTSAAQTNRSAGKETQGDQTETGYAVRGQRQIDPTSSQLPTDRNDSKFNHNTVNKLSNNSDPDDKSTRNLLENNRQSKHNSDMNTNRDRSTGNTAGDAQISSRTHEIEKHAPKSNTLNDSNPNTSRTRAESKLTNGNQTAVNAESNQTKAGNHTDSSLKKQSSRVKGDLTDPSNQKILLESLKDHAARSQKLPNEFYSPRLSPGGPSPDFPILKDRDIDDIQVKTFFVHRNGDLFDSAKKVVYNRRYCRTFEMFLQELTNMLDYPNAIRKLHTPNNFSQVNSFDDIRSGRTYVALSKNEKLQKFDYHVAGQPLNFIFKKKQNFANNGDFPDPPKLKPRPKPIIEGRLKKELEEKKSKTILVYRNGDEYTRAIIILLKPIEQQNIDMVIKAIEERVILPNNKPIHRLYDLNGTMMKDPDDLDDGHFYVAAANESYNPRPYGQIQLPQVFSSKVKPTKIKYLNHPATPMDPLKPNSVPAYLRKGGESPIDRAKTRTLNSTEVLELPEYTETPKTPPPVVKHVPFDHSSRRDEYEAIQKGIRNRSSKRHRSLSLSPPRLTDIMPKPEGDSLHHTAYNEEELKILTERDPKKEKNRMMDDAEFKVVIDNYYKNAESGKTPRFEFPLDPLARVVPHVQVVGRYVPQTINSKEDEKEEQSKNKQSKKEEEQSLRKGRGKKSKSEENKDRNNKSEAKLKSSLKRDRSKSKSRVNFEEESKKGKRNRSKSTERPKMGERQSRDRTKKSQSQSKSHSRGQTGSSKISKSRDRSRSKSNSRGKSERGKSSSQRRNASKDKNKGSRSKSRDNNKSKTDSRSRSKSKEKKKSSKNRSNSEIANDRKPVKFKPFLVNNKSSKKGPRSVSLQTDKVLLEVYIANNRKEFEAPVKKNLGKFMPKQRGPKLTEKVIYIQSKVREKTPPEKIKISDPKLHENLDILGRVKNRINTFQGETPGINGDAGTKSKLNKQQSTKPSNNSKTNESKPSTMKNGHTKDTNEKSQKEEIKKKPQQTPALSSDKQEKSRTDSQSLAKPAITKQPNSITTGNTKPTASSKTPQTSKTQSDLKSQPAKSTENLANKNVNTSDRPTATSKSQPVTKRDPVSVPKTKT